MWFNYYGDSFNSEDEAREDANDMIDWEDYEEQILKNDPLFLKICIIQVIKMIFIQWH